MTSSRLIVGPFNRVEGDLEVRLEIDGGRVREAFVTAPLFRDFEHLMLGRPALDAIAIAPRICGICSVSQSAAAQAALAAAAGIDMPANGRAAVNLMLALENAADHLIHFSLFFMPDFARDAYGGRSWHVEARRRFKAGAGVMSAEAAKARGRLFAALGILAGKWPHSLALQPGGSTKPIDQAERMRLIEIIREFARFLEERLFGLGLEEVQTLEEPKNFTADAGLFFEIASDLDLWRLGESKAQLMSGGSFPDPGSGACLLASGLWRDGALADFDLRDMAEDTSRSWLADGLPRHPEQGQTEPWAGKAGGYSWCKAPRLSGRTVEVGALARQVIDGQPMVGKLHARFGQTVAVRMAARLVELARLPRAMESWARALEPGQSFCNPFPDGVTGRGVGLVEAARGTLGHWLTLEEGRIAAYQIVAPTSWNFSPRDGSGLPGPVEAALAGIPVEAGSSSPLAVQHVVRSYDPCMACTVH